MLKQQHVYHGHFVHDHYIAVQRVVFVVLEPHVAGHVVFHRQHAVNGACLVAGEIRNAAGCPTGGGGDHHAVALLFVQFDNGIQRGSFTGARAAGEDHNAAGKGSDNGFSLQRRVLHALFLLLCIDHFFEDLLIFRCTEVLYHTDAVGDIAFRNVVVFQIDKIPSVLFIDVEGVVFQCCRIGNFKFRLVDLQILARRRTEPIQRQAGVAAVGVVL